MSNKPRGYGMTAELDKKKDAKFSAGESQECIDWMKKVLEYGGLEEDAKVLDIEVGRNTSYAYVCRICIFLCICIRVCIYVYMYVCISICIGRCIICI